ncbi:hypothetical protein HMN09_00928000 [Mycena chlorophos]|uniref:Uncharacterized protein n=1 Tax=Mycena chlorophos TaxID=658473 RepID=A0A8H6SK25_MYCCL|nr:hypothetical protein HMN09_00928000 [Mycena chlorophos]
MTTTATTPTPNSAFATSARTTGSTIITLVLLAMTTSAAFGFLKRGKKGKGTANANGKDVGAESDRESGSGSTSAFERQREREWKEKEDELRRMLDARDAELKAVNARVVELDGECAILREDADSRLLAVQSRVAELEEELVSKQGNMQELETGKRNAEQERIVAEERAAGLELELRIAQQAMEQLRSELDDSTATNVALEDRLQTLQTTLSESQHRNSSLSTELSILRAQLPPPDRLTDQAVLVLVQALNTEIRDSAAFFADAFEFEDKTVPSPEGEVDYTTPEMAEIVERATEILGADMVALLRSTSHHADASLVRLAVQGGCVEYARWMSGSWFFEDPEDEQLLADIYARVRADAALSQADAGRWRAVTHAHVQELIHDDTGPALGEYFVDALVNVLLAAGFRSSAAALHSLISERGEFQERIGALVRLARGLNRAIGAEVTGCELKALSAPPGGAFDAPTMVSVDHPEGEMPEEDDVVLCTCELGLARSDKVEGQGAWTRKVLLKPRVMLVSAGERTPTRTSSGVAGPATRKDSEGSTD